MKEILLIALGSSIGGVLRYSVGLLFSGEHIAKFTHNFSFNLTTFPLATFAVNALGSFLLGLFLAIFSKNNALQSEFFVFKRWILW